MKYLMENTVFVRQQWVWKIDGTIVPKLGVPPVWENKIYDNRSLLLVIAG